MQWSEPEPPAPRPLLPTPQRRARAADPLAGLAEELSRAPTAPAAPEPSSAEPVPRLPLRRDPRAARPQPVPPPAPAPAPEAQFNVAADQNLAEMAQRLEAALRRPAAKPDAAQPAPAPKAAAQTSPEPMQDEFEEDPPPPAPPPRAPTQP
jgi:flagellar protein FliO/FliZ